MLYIAIDNSIGGGTGLPGSGGGFTNIYSLKFDGVDDRVDTASIDLGLENTISFWAKRTETNFFGMVWGGTSQSNYYTIYLPNNNKLLYRVGSGANTFSNSDIISAIGGSAWFHCALVRNNSGADVLCYINGVLKETKTNIVGSTDNTIVQNIGSRGPTPLDFEITGYLDQMSLFDSALSASQISDIYNSGTPTDLTSLSPLGWWRFDEGSGTTAIDSGSGGNNGTLINGVAYSTNVP